VDIVADASAFLAVVLNEASRDSIIRSTTGHGIVAPEILPYEVGNALVVVRKKGRLTDHEVLPVAIPAAIKLAMQFGIYAYDAYYLQCCIENRLPLLSLDVRMCEVARRMRIQIVE
jgi:predicted nucleic acid-binding protein